MLTRISEGISPLWRRLTWHRACPFVPATGGRCPAGKRLKEHHQGLGTVELIWLFTGLPGVGERIDESLTQLELAQEGGIDGSTD